MMFKAIFALSRLGQIFESVNARQLLFYGVSVGGTMSAGFVLVFILVRMLSAEAYGGLVLIKALLLVVMSIAGMGLSQAAVRWSGLNVREGLVLGTVLGGVSFFVLPAVALLVTLIMVFADRLKLVMTLPLVIALVTLVFSYLLNNELVNWQRARSRAKYHAFISTFRAIQQMVAIIVGVLLMKNVAGYVFGLAVGELFLLICLGYGYRADITFRVKLLSKMLSYGWPHTFVIASGFALNYVDRYMLSFLTNNNSMVAYYDAASMIVVSVLAVLVRPFNLFLFPAYTLKYDTEGQEATAMLVNRAQRLFLIAGFCISTVLVAFRELLMQLLFPTDYLVASSIFAAVAYSTLLNGVFMATVAGLYLSQKTILVGVAAIMAVTSNIFANWLLIPIWGIDGAALGTAISSLIQLLVGYYFSRSVLAVRLPIVLLIVGTLWLMFLSWVTR